MKTTKLGDTGLEVSRIGLGCVTFGREIDESASYQILDYALAKGINLFDTAEAYGGGQSKAYRERVLGITDVRERTDEWHSSEKILGRWLRGRQCRDRIVLQTKPAPPYARARLLASLEGSLERLQTDVIDLYLFHQFDPSTPLEESLEAMTEAVQAGKVRVAGCSNFSLEQLQRSWELSEKGGLVQLQIVQPVYNILNRDIETQILPYCRKRKISVVPYSPLGAGFLTGKYTPDRTQIPRGSRFDVIPGHADLYFSQGNFKAVEQLRELSVRAQIPMAQLAVGWVLSNPDLASVLVGARTTAHLDNALAALAIEFLPEWRKEIDSWRNDSATA